LARDVFYILRYLEIIADLSGLIYMDCCEHAWEQIKDRKGYLNEHGVFVKLAAAQVV